MRHRRARPILQPEMSALCPVTLGHYIENTGDSDIIFLEMFKAPRYQDISLNDWLTHIPVDW